MKTPEKQPFSDYQTYQQRLKIKIRFFLPSYFYLQYEDSYTLNIVSKKSDFTSLPILYSFD